MKKTAPGGLTEAQEQSLLFEWADISSKTDERLRCLDSMFAIPNGGTRHLLEAVNLKRQGVRAGVPDIFLPVGSPLYHGLFIEMKKKVDGRTSVEQKKWIIMLMHQGYKAVVCNGFEEAMVCILKYVEEARRENKRFGQPDMGKDRG